MRIEENEFLLHFPNKKRNSILDAKTDELIILYQTIDSGRYFTHLVQPIDNKVIEENAQTNFRFGRFVKVIAFTGEEGKIPFNRASLDLRNRGWGSAENITNLLSKNELKSYQIKIWNLFKPFFENDLRNSEKDYQFYLNDDLSEDFESKEGKLLFRNHRIRERDSSLTHKKKEVARQKNKLFCEVCRFSFIKTYSQDYIECHHIVPINEGERTTKLEDLALVCSNCHRMLHRKIDGKYLSINELKTIIIFPKH
ncbi:MAG: HNH endonuclease [Acidobacteriota bacterium]